jgi:hypothetical protein
MVLVMSSKQSQRWTATRIDKAKYHVPGTDFQCLSRSSRGSTRRLYFFMQGCSALLRTDACACDMSQQWVFPSGDRCPQLIRFVVSVVDNDSRYA